MGKCLWLRKVLVCEAFLRGRKCAKCGLLESGFDENEVEFEIIGFSALQ